MGLFGGFVVFAVLWWMVLFTVLPFGVTSQAEAGSVNRGTDPGAPVESRLGRKMLITTGITTVLFALIVMAFELEWIVLADI